MRWNFLNKLITPTAYLLVFGLIGAAVWFGRPYWQPQASQEVSQDHDEQDLGPKVMSEEAKTLELKSKARANLKLLVAPAKPQTYWRTLSIPGVVVDRPGQTDRGITAPLAGVVTQVHAFEGDIIRPGEKLFTIRLVSDYLQQSQSDLFKANREIEILNQEIQRIKALIANGSLPGKRKLELEQQISRQSAKVEAYRQDLTSRGLSEQQVNRIQSGEFLTTIDVIAPSVNRAKQPAIKKVSHVIADLGSNDPTETRMLTPNHQDFYEVQELKVELGQQVESGASLAVLANHFSLYIKGHAFKKEASRLAKAAEENWDLSVEFTEDTAADWPVFNQAFQIRHLANTTNPNSRTFDFFIPLENQSRTYEKEDRLFVIWRYRPGQRVNIMVPVEELDDVLVLPAEGVFFDGPEAFVFHQNGDLFHRIAVEVIHRDRLNVVIANDGSISPGFYLAQNAAASLNRVLKSQSASGLQPGFHMHADGSVHAAH